MNIYDDIFLKEAIEAFLYLKAQLNLRFFRPLEWADSRCSSMNEPMYFPLNIGIFQPAILVCRSPSVQLWISEFRFVRLQEFS